MSSTAFNGIYLPTKHSFNHFNFKIHQISTFHLVPCRVLYFGSVVGIERRDGTPWITRLVCHWCWNSRQFYHFPLLMLMIFDFSFLFHSFCLIIGNSLLSGESMKTTSVVKSSKSERNGKVKDVAMRRQNGKYEWIFKSKNGMTSWGQRRRRRRQRRRPHTQFWNKFILISSSLFIFFFYLLVIFHFVFVLNTKEEDSVSHRRQ